MVEHKLGTQIAAMQADLNKLKGATAKEQGKVANTEKDTKTSSKPMEKKPGTDRVYVATQDGKTKEGTKGTQDTRVSVANDSEKKGKVSDPQATKEGKEKEPNVQVAKDSQKGGGKAKDGASYIDDGSVQVGQGKAKDGQDAKKDGTTNWVSTDRQSTKEGKQKDPPVQVAQDPQKGGGKQKDGASYVDGGRVQVADGKAKAGQDAKKDGTTNWVSTDKQSTKEGKQKDPPVRVAQDPQKGAAKQKDTERVTTDAQSTKEGKQKDTTVQVATDPQKGGAKQKDGDAKLPATGWVTAEDGKKATNTKEKDKNPTMQVAQDPQKGAIQKNPNDTAGQAAKGPTSKETDKTGVKVAQDPNKKTGGADKKTGTDGGVQYTDGVRVGVEGKKGSGTVADIKPDPVKIGVDGKGGTKDGTSGDKKSDAPVRVGVEGKVKDGQADKKGADSKGAERVGADDSKYANPKPPTVKVADDTQKVKPAEKKPSTNAAQTKEGTKVTDSQTVKVANDPKKVTGAEKKVSDQTVKSDDKPVGGVMSGVQKGASKAIEELSKKPATTGGVVAGVVAGVADQMAKTGKKVGAVVAGVQKETSKAVEELSKKPGGTVAGAVAGVADQMAKTGKNVGGVVAGVQKEASKSGTTGGVVAGAISQASKAMDGMKKKDP